MPPAAARAVYMWMPQRVIVSRLNAAVSQALGHRVTWRNWATILKLMEMTEFDLARLPALSLFDIALVVLNLPYQPVCEWL